jgi:hypothetical protein
MLENEELIAMGSAPWNSPLNVKHNSIPNVTMSEEVTCLWGAQACELVAIYLV